MVCSSDNGTWVAAEAFTFFYYIFFCDNISFKYMNIWLFISSFLYYTAYAHCGKLVVWMYSKQGLEKKSAIFVRILAKIRRNKSKFQV